MSYKNEHQFTNQTSKCRLFASGQVYRAGQQPQRLKETLIAGTFSGPSFGCSDRIRIFPEWVWPGGKAICTTPPIDGDLIHQLFS